MTIAESDEIWRSNRAHQAKLLAAQAQLRQQHETLRSAQNALRLSRARYQELFDFAPFGYVTLSNNGTIVEANMAAALLLGQMRVLLRNSPFSLYVATSDVRVFLKHLRKCRDASDEQAIDLSLRRGRFSFFPAHLVTAPARQGTSVNRVVFRTTIMDMTELKRTQEALSVAKNELEQRVEERTGQLREAYEELAGEISARQRLEREILQISEREKRRFGQDLHDDICQQLGGIGLLTQAVGRMLQEDKPEHAAKLEEVSSMITNLIGETKRIARGLHPAVLSTGGLSLALAEIAERVSTVLPCEVRANCDPRLPEETALALYRIAQEATNNALRHANASHALVQLRCDDRNLLLTIEDDGDGFRGPRRVGHGMGLDIMHYRARSIGAKLAVEKRAPKGTRVSISLLLGRARALARDRVNGLAVPDAARVNTQ